MLQVYGCARVGCLLWFSTYDRYCVGFTVVCCGALGLMILRYFVLDVRLLLLLDLYWMVMLCCFLGCLL